jgi:hypothetical protein
VPPRSTWPSMSSGLMTAPKQPRSIAQSGDDSRYLSGFLIVMATA